MRRPLKRPTKDHRSVAGGEQGESFHVQPATSPVEPVSLLSGSDPQLLIAAAAGQHLDRRHQSASDLLTAVNLIDDQSQQPWMPASPFIVSKGAVSISERDRPLNLLTWPERDEGDG